MGYGMDRRDPAVRAGVRVIADLLRFLTVAVPFGAHAETRA